LRLSNLGASCLTDIGGSRQPVRKAARNARNAVREAARKAAGKPFGRPRKARGGVAAASAHVALGVAHLVALVRAAVPAVVAVDRRRRAAALLVSRGTRSGGIRCAAAASAHVALGVAHLVALVRAAVPAVVAVDRRRRTGARLAKLVLQDRLMRALKESLLIIFGIAIVVVPAIVCLREGQRNQPGACQEAC